MKSPLKPSTSLLQSASLLDQLRERIRYLQCSLGMEKVYLLWPRFFIRSSAHGGQMRWPRTMASSESAPAAHPQTSGSQAAMVWPLHRLLKR
jgi:hypothetical protein